LQDNNALVLQSLVPEELARYGDAFIINETIPFTVDVSTEPPPWGTFYRGTKDVYFKRPFKSPPLTFCFVEYEDSSQQLSYANIILVGGGSWAITSSFSYLIFPDRIQVYVAHFAIVTFNLVAVVVEYKLPSQIKNN